MSVCLFVHVCVCLDHTSRPEPLVMGEPLLCTGGRLSTKPVAKRLVIDVREFMSSLPSVLHQQGLQIVPVTLEVSFASGHKSCCHWVAC